MKNTLKISCIVVAIVFSTVVVFLWFQTPLNDREWSRDNKVLPYAEFNGNEVTVYNVRNFNYRSVYDYDADYYDKTYDLSLIKSVDFINEPFSGLAAHTFLSFGFEDGEYVSISVEVRREEGESFNIVRGLLKQFELVYVIADESDVIGLRTSYREDDVYLYPIKVSKQKARSLFVDMLKRANNLKENPEFYNTLTNNCTTNIVDHVNNIAEEEARVRYTWRYVLPKFSDKLAYDLGLIDAEGSFEEVQTRFNITDIAQELEGNPEFSIKIRRELRKGK